MALLSRPASTVATLRRAAGGDRASATGALKTGWPRVGRTSIVVVALCAVAFIGAGSASAAKTPPLWTETYAEQTLLKKLVVPCKYVRTRYACSIKIAQSYVDNVENAYQKAIESCEAYASDPPRRDGCLEHVNKNQARIQAGQLTEAEKTARAQPYFNLDRVTNGFPLTDAECIGSGTGFRFRLFRCKISVEDPFNKGSLNFYRPVIVSGRLLITVTGKATFRWSVI